MEMTSIERIHNIMQRKQVDRIGLMEHFESDTHRAWTEDRYFIDRGLELGTY
jgi:hypothetical protein